MGVTTQTETVADATADDEASDLVDVGDQKLALLDAPLTPVPVLADTLAQAAGDGERPRLRIDLTDPPTQPVATIGGIEATGANADEAMKLLAQTVSRAIRTARAADQAGDVTPVKGP